MKPNREGWWLRISDGMPKLIEVHGGEPLRFNAPGARSWLRCSGLDGEWAPVDEVIRAWMAQQEVGSVPPVSAVVPEADVREADPRCGLCGVERSEHADSSPILRSINNCAQHVGHDEASCAMCPNFCAGPHRWVDGWDLSRGFPEQEHLRCSVCRGRIWQTPGGTICVNGHGGADTVHIRVVGSVPPGVRPTPPAYVRHSEHEGYGPEDFGGSDECSHFLSKGVRRW